MRVIVINSRNDYGCSGGFPFPPIGSIGSVISGPDEFNEYDVVFDGYPHPSIVVGDPSWITHKSMIVFIDDQKILKEETNVEFELI